MSLELRNGQTYFYHAHRVGNRVVKTYSCRGESAQIIAASVAGMRQEKRDKRYLERLDAADVRNRQERAFFACDVAAAAAELLVESAGYHRHDRGRWRKKRMTATHTDKATLTVPASIDEQHDIMREYVADKKNPHKQAHAAAVLKANPHLFATTYFNDVERTLRLFDFYSFDPILQQCIRNEVDELRNTLYEGRARKSIPAAELLLIERVVVCQMMVSDAETAYYDKAERSHAEDEHRQRNIDRTHKRLLQAMKALAEVRRLALPAVNVAMPGSVQINQGEKQINLSAGKE